MKRFGNRARTVVRPRIIEASYRVVRRDEAMSAAPTQSTPLTPAGSFSELAARAYGQSRDRGAEIRVDAVV